MQCRYPIIQENNDTIGLTMAELRFIDMTRLVTHEQAKLTHRATWYYWHNRYNRLVRMVLLATQCTIDPLHVSFS
jgi:hypothetical protein